MESDENERILMQIDQNILNIEKLHTEQKEQLNKIDNQIKHTKKTSSNSHALVNFSWLY